MRRLGILGGTFDPVHFGHLRPAVEVARALTLDELRLIPCRQSPHRDAPIAAASDRIAMLRAALDGTPDLGLDERELARPGPSYTIDTLEAIAAEEPDSALFLVVGADAASRFDHWHRWRAILEHVHLVVMRRPSWPLELPPALASARVDEAAALGAGAGGVAVIEVTRLDISATAVRELAATGGDLRFLVPEGVRAWIERNHLYQTTDKHNSHGNRSTG